MNDINISQKMKIIMQDYADNEYSKGDIKQDSDEYVKQMIYLLFGGLFYLNDKIEESLNENDKEKALYYLGKMVLAIDIYRIEVGGKQNG